MLLNVLLSIMLTAAPAPDQPQVRQINPTAAEVTFADGATVTVDFYGEDVFRLFQDNGGGIIRDPAARPPAQILVDNPRREAGTVSATSQGDKAVVSTSAVKVEFDGEGVMTVTDLRSGKAVVEGLEPASFGSRSSSLVFRMRDGEHFYGGGVQNGRFSHRGQKIAIENTNNWVDGGVASPAPFYWSTEGYGLMWHTFKKGVYDFGASNPDQVQLSHEEGYLDVFLMVGEGAVTLLNDFYQLTGNPVLMPKFGFYQGHLNAYNRDWWVEVESGGVPFEDGKMYKESQKDNGGIRESLNGENDNYQFSARAVVDRYLDNDMPLGWVLPNDGYGAGYGQTGTLEGNIQNLREFGDYARSRGVEIGLWTQSDLHPKEGIEALLQRDIVREVRDAGVRVLKTDVAWVGAGYSFGLNGVADVGHIMPYYGSDARPFIISLDGWAGTQRYATIWSGDQTGGDWEYIRFHIPTFIGSGLSGQPNITSDVDGIFGGNNIPVNVREFQWKTFTPMELNMDGWGALPKYPQAHGEPATSINRWWLKLKSELLPYTYTIAREAVDGLPMIRAMFLEYGADVPAGAPLYDYLYGPSTQYQYMYGPYFLVAPVWKNTRMDSEGNDIRDGIWLPEGRWIDWMSGDVYEGGRIVNNFEAPLWKLPVFVKAGAIIPMTVPNNTVAEIPSDLRIYELYPYGESSFTEYDDDGRTQAYLSGSAVTTLVRSSVVGDRLRVSVDPAEGDYEGYQAEKATVLRINVSAAPDKVAASVVRGAGKASGAAAVGAGKASGAAAGQGKTSDAAAGKTAKVKLTEVGSMEEFEAGENVWFYCEAPELNRFATEGSEFAEVSVKKNPVLMVKLAAMDVRSCGLNVEVRGFEYAPEDRLLVSEGALSAPVLATGAAAGAASGAAGAASGSDGAEGAEDVGAKEITVRWEAVSGADYYEIEFGGMLYSTIRDCYFGFDGLTPETSYDFKVRAVNASGVSDWTSATYVTTSDPLEFALRGVKAQVTCEDQPGSGVHKLFDFDRKTQWHTKWGVGTAVPFVMNIDLRSVNQLDRLEYLPREDAGNGTILAGEVSYSENKVDWSEPVPFSWTRDGSVKTFDFGSAGAASGGESGAAPVARYLRISVSEAVGNFGSGQEMYIYKVADTESVLQGDINRDGKIDENDLTSYMNYTGLRRGDADFDYVSIGDINRNGRIDVYDISVVATELDGGVSARQNAAVEGVITVTPDKKAYKAGEEVRLTVRGTGMKYVNALGFALEYNPEDFEYLGTEIIDMKDMVNLTRDRLHTDGAKVLYPTFVNKGNNFLLEGDADLFVIRLAARRDCKAAPATSSAAGTKSGSKAGSATGSKASSASGPAVIPTAQDIMLVGRNLVVAE